MKIWLSYVITIFIIVLQGYYFESFYTFGNNLLYDFEGIQIASVSGYKFIRLSSMECAESCLSMRQASGCCNSFTYNSDRRECQLKFQPDSTTAVSFNRDGWQTYTLDQFPQSTQLATVRPLQTSFSTQSHSYVHIGMNQLAADEGQEVSTFDGKEFLQSVAPDDCAKACNRVQTCNSFAFNPNKNGGTCYLKDNLNSSRVVITNIEGWRTYWKDSLDKCFATCNYNNFCIVCLEDNFCFER